MSSGFQSVLPSAGRCAPTILEVPPWVMWVVPRVLGVVHRVLAGVPRVLGAPHRGSPPWRAP